MKAITLDALGTPPALRDDLTEPMPGAGELLVRVQASSVNPVDNAIAAGMLSGMGVEHEFPVTLGRDYAGVVEQVGATGWGGRRGGRGGGSGRHQRDAVLDLVSYAPGAFDGALKADGRVASPNGAAGDGPGRTNVMASPTTENLERLAGLLEEGVEVPIQETYGLARAPEALAALGTTHTRGKLAIRVG